MEVTAQVIKYNMDNVTSAGIAYYEGLAVGRAEIDVLRGEMNFNHYGIPENYVKYYDEAYRKVFDERRRGEDWKTVCNS